VLGVTTLGSLAGCGGPSSSDHDESERGPTNPNTPSPGTVIDPTATLAAEDGDDDDAFGWSVALSSDGTTAVVGAHRDEDPNGDRAGAAYVFGRESDTWTQQAKLAADGGETAGFFGSSVATSADGTTALVGAIGASAAYVFQSRDGNWRQQTILTSEEGDTEDAFGVDVALSADGTTAFVGDPRADEPRGDASGSATVFQSAAGTWRRQATLTPEDGDIGDWFGESVAISADGDTVLAGAGRDENPNGAQSGAAYAFVRRENAWHQQSKLTAANGQPDARFGSHVALSGDGSTALVGAPSRAAADIRGRTSVFERAGGDWRQQTTLSARESATGTEFGVPVAISGDGTTAFVGARLTETTARPRTDVVCRFDRTSGNWQQRGKLVPGTTSASGESGSLIATSNDGRITLVGTPSAAEPNGGGGGAAAVFDL
jgi:hypothetical protein